MRNFQNYLSIRCDKIFEMHASFGGINGMEIILDPKFEPWAHCRRYGEVIETPLRLSTVPLPIQVPQGCPTYHEITPSLFRYIRDIEPEVQIGDKVYFDHNVVNPKNIIKMEGEEPNRMYYFRIRYDQIFCACREGKIIPIGSYVLVEPDREEWKDILKPTYSNIKDKDGNYILKDRSQWIQTKVVPGYKHLKGWVRHIGKPLKGDLPGDFKVGDHIIHARHADYLTTIENFDYYPVAQRHILGRYIEEAA